MGNPDGISAKLLRLGRRPIRVDRRQALVFIAAALAAGGGAVFLRSHRALELQDSIRIRLWRSTSFDGEAALTRARAAADSIRPLFRRKGAPRPGEWLSLFEEPGQTLNQYVRGFAPAYREAAGAIQVLPLGQFDARVFRMLADAVELMSLFYGRPVELLPAEPAPPLPADQRQGQGAAEQLYTDPLLALLKRRVSANAGALLAMTSFDLTPGAGWNFVFGIASLSDRIGLWSLYRLVDPRVPPEQQFRRVGAVALHELGHMFGIWHCRAYECCMNGSNTMQESDAAPLAFCPECDAKVAWRFRLEPGPRYARLAEFARARGLMRDAALWAACAGALKS